MSILDALLIISNVIILYQLVIKNKKIHKILMLLGFELTVVLCHLIFDTVRWQVLPLYILPVFVIVYYLFQMIEWVQLKKVLTTILMLIVILSQLVAIIFTLLLPVPKLTAPNGPYTVGTTTLNWVDTERVDIYDDQNRNRDIRLQIWYPAAAVGEDPANWFIDGHGTLQVFSEVYGYPNFLMNHLTTVKSHSYINVPILQDKENYPVIIISHGWSSIRNMHTNYAEALASNGYIVIAIDHTYASAVTRLNDGSIAELKSDILPETDFLDEAKEMIVVFSEDIDFVINRLSDLNNDHHLLKSKLDITQIGLLGHSTGAGADVYYALEHDVQAVVGMDPWVEPFNVTQSLEMPYMFFRSEEWSDGPNNGQLKNLTHEVYQIEGSKHQDFTMAYVLSPYLKLFGLGGGDTSDIQIKMILNFFDNILKNEINKKDELLNGYEQLHLKLVD